MWTARTTYRHRLLVLALAAALPTLGSAPHSKRPPGVAAANAGFSAATFVPEGERGPECPALKKGWFPECWVATHARIAFGNDRTLYWTPFTSDRWGNALGGYWQARALALLAGYGFDAYVGFQGPTWLAHLPKKVGPTTCLDKRAFKSACHTCQGDSWEHAHRCGGPWVTARDVIRDDTERAVEAWAAAGARKLPEYGAGDVVIQARCSKDTLLSHPEYGPAAFSFYSDNIPPASKRVYLVSESRAADPLCVKIQAARLAHLKRELPGAEVVALSGARGEDFARLLRAPIMFRDSQSSFGLWAGVANRGQVYSVPLLKEFAEDQKPDLGKDWHWVDAPVLYPGVARAESISLDDPQGIIAWLEGH